MEILNKTQKEILDIFSKVLDNEHFYLTGGTALAYFYLKHRKSNDLDFFTSSEELTLPFSHRLEEKLKAKEMDIQRQRGLHSFVELLAKKNEETTIIHLAQDAGFRLEQTKEFPEYPGLRIDSLIDIAANKLLALFSRATLRDFVDVFFLVKESKFSAEELMNNAKLKDSGFDLYWLGVALERINTFKKDSPELLLLIKPMDFEEMLIFFHQWRETIAKKLL